VSGEPRHPVSASRGWGWVIGGGTAAGLLATYPDLGPMLAGWLWWLVAGVAGSVWEVAPWWLVAGLVVVGVAALVFFAVRAWRGRNW
jgi:hypothetical protein